MGKRSSPKKRKLVTTTCVGLFSYISVRVARGHVTIVLTSTHPTLALLASALRPPRARSFVNDEGFMVTEDRWEDDESAATAPSLAASASTKAPSPKKAKVAASPAKKKQAAGGSDVPAKKKATSQGSMFSFFKKK